uniref:hypothetical protein n=1 Tax=Altererythrobacter segetis TaxID=1104773 RepID=UPI00140DA20A|nr:hypothetical protein [Altererythrobacter segetis]
MNAYGRYEGGAAARQRTTYDFGALPRSNTIDLDYVRASGLAQVRLQLAVLSGNRRGALRELDRLVEIDRQIEAGQLFGEGQNAGLKAHLEEQREAIASEKLVLMAAVEFPRLSPTERSAEIPQEEGELGVVEDTEFARKLLYGLAGVLTVIAIGTALAFGVPLLAAL